ncbi:pseudouridine synthase [Salinisphaera sp. USBA-960]|uniref:pseudouridine synthase n=1 Tax=Salinisphaera orenii TaxID=856731 RepID=UPI000DBE3B21|nr:pseudouridine synthase [Salifodinibacter halophilus]NNC25646.1 pseudouridine synthase [Salifodinibacter halophilus]
MAERLQKLLAGGGYGSRREIERQIEAGRIRVNGTVASLGDRAAADDRIERDGQRLNVASRAGAPTRVLLYKKHVDQVVTRSDPDGRPTVFRGLPKLSGGRWLAVGRLDVNTSGLLLMTTDGELKRRLEHPSFEIVRRYAVRVHGTVDNAMLDRLLAGVELEDGVARFEQIRVADDAGRSNHWFDVDVCQGKNRVVRRLFESQGVTVSRLIRTGFGPVALPGGIKAGRYQELTAKQIRALAAAVDLSR